MFLQAGTDTPLNQAVSAQPSGRPRRRRARGACWCGPGVVPL